MRLDLTNQSGSQTIDLTGGGTTDMAAGLYGVRYSFQCTTPQASQSAQPQLEYNDGNGNFIQPSMSEPMSGGGIFALDDTTAPPTVNYIPCDKGANGIWRMVITESGPSPGIAQYRLSIYTTDIYGNPA